MLRQIARSRLPALAALCLLAIGGCQQPPDPDVNNDGRVDVLDATLVGNCFGADFGDLPQCRAADLVRDGVIDEQDLQVVADAFGQTGFPFCGDATRDPGEQCDGDDAPGCPGNCRTDCSCQIDLEVAITEPATNTLTQAPSIDVRGTVGVLAERVIVDEVEAVIEAGRFFAEAVPLDEGTNTLTATATSAAGNAVISSVSVVRDSEPPTVRVDSPEAGLVTERSSVDVRGMVNDVVVGTVSGDDIEVTANGAPAMVANRSFLLADLPIDTSVEGAVTRIRVEATDAAGNRSEAVERDVVFRVPVDPRIRLVSGNHQIAPIGSTLSNPLVAELVDGAGEPVAGERVIFKVVENNGRLDDGQRQARSVAVETDAAGLASAVWTLGTRAGAGNQLVEATAVGFAGRVAFSAAGTTGAPALIIADSGNEQRGSAGRPLPRPFVAVVVDEGRNRLAGVPVAFTVIEGGGRFESGPSATVETDADGRALAVLVLGPDDGIENNVVRATFDGNPGSPATFRASGRASGDPANTAVSGVVLDNEDLPIEGVTVSIVDTDLETETGPDGQFRLATAPVGTLFLDADGSTAARPGVWPTLEYEIVTIPGIDNALPRPIHLVELAVDDCPVPGTVPPGTGQVGQCIFVSETTGGRLEIPQIPGFAVDIQPDSVRFADGATSGLLSVSLVKADKVPMTPGFGQQPRVIVTVQPPGVEFDPPAALTFPNTGGLAPGQITEMYSFDHDLGQFVAIGTGSVSGDGIVIRSDPGVGILKAGWHSEGDPQETGDAAECPPCQTELAGGCVPDPLQEGVSCALGGPSFTSSGIFVEFDSSCGGTCSGGQCQEVAGKVSQQQLIPSIDSAMAQLFGDCPINPELAATVRQSLGNVGLVVACREVDGACGEATTGVMNNIISISSQPGCIDVQDLKSTILHEIVHAAADYLGEDAPRACQELCFPGTGEPDPDTGELYSPDLCR